MLAKYVSLCEWRISHVVTGNTSAPGGGLVRRALGRVRETPGAAAPGGRGR